MTVEAYKKALLCLKKKRPAKHKNSVLVTNLFDALEYFSFSIKKYPKKESTLLNLLKKDFDIDTIVNFSGAKSYWEAMYDILYKGRKPKVALNQMLFSGNHINARKYFKGIEMLANKNAQQVSEILSKLLPYNPVRKMIDLGAGPGIYSKTFVEQGIACNSTCLDFPYVIDQYNDIDKRLNWRGEDLLEYIPSSDEKFGLIFLANLLHHYNPNKIDKIFNNISNSIENDAFLIIQDYILWPQPAYSSTYAAILGIHFALTTGGGRCYTNAEIVSMVEKRLVFMKFYALINLDQTDLLIFKRVKSS